MRVKELASFERELVRWQEQQQDALRLMAYFNKVWQRKKNAAKDTIVHHPITRLYETVRPCNRFIVLFAAMVWFQREFRGNSVTGKLSGWSVRTKPKLNSQMARLMKELTVQNTEAVEEMWQVAAQKNTVEVTIKTKVTFEDEEQAALFAELLNTMQKEEA